MHVSKHCGPVQLRASGAEERFETGDAYGAIDGTQSL